MTDFNRPIRIATRGSALALAQANNVLAQCQTVAVDDVVDEKPYSGAKLKLYILRYNGP